MADLGNVSKLKLPNGNVVHVKDSVSGYVSTVAWDSNNNKLTKTANGVTTDVVTIETIKNALALPDPMVFKGSLGTGGTITTLPTAAASNTGFTYKVITAGTYEGQAAEVGDTFVSDGSAWILIPSGDEPSGTVTSVGTGAGLTGGPITSSGTISLDASGVTAGSYGPSTNVSPNYGESFSVPYVTVDTYGRVTGVSTKTITLPASDNTDTKVSTSLINDTLKHYLILGNDTTSAETKYYDKTGLSYNTSKGTTSALGNSELYVGNSTAQGTAGNKQGKIVLYGWKSYPHIIQAESGGPTANRSIRLPDKTGTVALLSDLSFEMDSTDEKQLNILWG